MPGNALMKYTSRLPNKQDLRRMHIIVVGNVSTGILDNRCNLKKEHVVLFLSTPCAPFGCGHIIFKCVAQHIFSSPDLKEAAKQHRFSFAFRLDLMYKPSRLFFLSGLYFPSSFFIKCIF